MEVAGGSGGREGGDGDSDDSGRCLFFEMVYFEMRRGSLLRGSLWELVGMCRILRGQASCLNFF